MESSNPPYSTGLGSLDSAPLSPPLPASIAEWAAILPLICNLANQQDDYTTTGDVALQGELSVGLFPRLGTLLGLSRLLGRGTEYLDHASTRGHGSGSGSGSGYTVWDVNWGSVFPCANGATVSAISRHLLRRNKGRVQRMPERFPSETQPAEPEKPSEKDSIRRYQKLHVYRLKRGRTGTSLRCNSNRFFRQLPSQVLFPIVLSVSVFLSGCYGTAAMILCSVASSIVAQAVQISRPSGYLKNNEDHGACMLVAAHENASEWHLYIGDRAVVDTLLNKPMFHVPNGHSSQLAAKWFLFAQFFQLATMTFVAAHKGRDGVCLMVLLAATWAVSSIHSSSEALASDWLEREGIDAEVKSFEFGGRFGMMGAIQVFNQGTVTRWMDTILVPHPRRDVWLNCLAGEGQRGRLTGHDAKWLEIACETALASAQVLLTEFSDNGGKSGAAQA